MKKYQFQSIFKDYFQEYILLRNESRNQATVSCDKHYLGMFDSYLYDGRIAVDGITEDVVYKWIESLSFSRRTSVGAVSSVRMFLKYLGKCGIPVFIPEIPKCHDDYIPYLYSEEEVRRIFEYADSGNVSGRNIYLCVEIPMLLRLLLGCGLRLGETLSLRFSDVDLENKLLLIKHAKRDRQRIVPMIPELAEILESYCMALGIYGSPDAWLFPGMKSGTHLREINIDTRFKGMLQKLDITMPDKKNRRGPCLHCFRHLFVLRSLRKLETAGVRIDDSIPYLSLYLGHENLYGTEKYMKFAPEMFPDELDRFNEFTMDIFPEVGYEE